MFANGLTFAGPGGGPAFACAFTAPVADIAAVSVVSPKLRRKIFQASGWQTAARNESHSSCRRPECVIVLTILRQITRVVDLAIDRFSILNIAGAGVGVAFVRVRFSSVSCQPRRVPVGWRCARAPPRSTSGRKQTDRKLISAPSAVIFEKEFRD